MQCGRRYYFAPTKDSPKLRNGGNKRENGLLEAYIGKSSTLAGRLSTYMLMF